MHPTAARIALALSLSPLPTAAVAQAVGVSRPTIESWAHGTTSPTLRHLDPLARALACDAAWLVFGARRTRRPTRPR